MLSMENPSLETGLRGLSYLEVEVTGPNRDLHSGVYGGAVANPATILCQLIASLHDAYNHIAIPGFYDDVLPLSEADRVALNKAPFDLEEYKSAWKLDPAVHHINHGSFGAIPTVVREEQARWSDHVQSNPVQFYAREAMPAVQAARGKIAAFLGQRADQIALVRNTTEGSSTTMRGFPFKAGDEAVVLDHEYGAVTYSVERAIVAAGGRLVEIKVPRLASDEEVVKIVEASFTSKTVMFVVDHVTSATARTFPVQALSDLCRSRGIASGASAPDKSSPRPVGPASLTFIPIFYRV
jgi:hypothetical protein